MTAQQTLLLLDGTSVVRRVYEAVPGEDSAARVDGAITASLHSIKRALSDHQPTHFLAAFDHGGCTWRHELMPGFKATRAPMFQGLRDALPRLYAAMQEIGLSWTSPAGVEADDVIATIATRAASRGFHVVVASNDVDMCALLTTGVRVYNHFAKAWRNEGWLAEQWGIAPEQVPDAMALVGEEKKSVPGIFGIGTKVAAKLLAEHKDLEGVISAASSMKGKLGPRIVEGASACRLARRLFTLKRDVDLTISPRQLALPNRRAR